jgi:PIN domain nuclease of toxin-antitoxin system
MPFLLDSSAVLAYLWGERGAERVGRAFSEGPVGCTVANWAEVVAKVVAKGGDWDAAEAALICRGLALVPISGDDAVAVGRLWDRHRSLSPG